MKKLLISNRNVLVTIILAFLVLTNFFSVSQYQRSEGEINKLEIAVDDLRRNYSNETEFFNRYIKVTTIKTVLDDSVKISISSTYPQLNSDLKNSSKVVFLYPKESCSVCLKKIYQDLFILSQKIGVENILIFTTSEYRTDLISPEVYGFDIYPIDSLALEVNDLNQPLLFVLNSKWQINSMFLPDLFDSFRGYYFNKTLTSYF